MQSWDVQNICLTIVETSGYEGNIDNNKMVQNLLEFTKIDNHNHGACVMPNSNRCVLSPPTYNIIDSLSLSLSLSSPHSQTLSNSC